MAALELPGNIVFYSGIVISFLSLCWLITEPSWEPMIVLVGSISTLIYSEYKNMRHVKKIIELFFILTSKKIQIDSKNQLKVDFKDLNTLISKAVLGKPLKVYFEHIGAKEFKRHASKIEKSDIETSHALNRQAQNIENKVKLFERCLKRIIWLFEKKYISMPISDSADLAQKLLDLIFDSPVTPQNYSKMDIYRAISKSGEVSYPIYISNVDLQLIEEAVTEKFGDSAKGLLRVPHSIQVIDIPNKIIEKEIVPAHVLAFETRYDKLEENSDFWTYLSWSIGVG